MNFWSVVSRIILKGRIVILLLIALATYFLYTQTANIKFSHTEANLLPADHPVNIEYDKFLEIC
jgi:predicted RND superfamily exporter protein